MINDGNSPLRIISPSNTRWLSRYNALVRIHEQYLELTTHFSLAKEKERCYTARVLHAMYQDEQNRIFIVFLKPLLSEFQRVNLLFQHTHADQFRLFEELQGLILSLLRRILGSSAVSLMVNMDFEINYLPPDQVDYGHEFLIELAKSKLSDTQKSEIKIRCFAFLKAAAKAVLKRMPPALDSLLKLKFLSPVICLSQFRPLI